VLYYHDHGPGAAFTELAYGAGGSYQWNNYLVAGGQVVGMHVEHSVTGPATLYFHKDHLGSVCVISNAAGVVVERLSYDAWGKRRFPDGTDDPAGALTSVSPRGFTGHEMLDSVDLVHMNGRVYDPLIGRFGSADPVTESPFSSQGWNRYSYVGNSPVNFTDPSGYCFLGCFWNSLFKGFQSLLQKYPIIGTILRVAASAMCLGAGPLCAPIAATLTSAFVAGVTSGKLSVALKAGFITAVTFAVTQFISDHIGGGLQTAYGTESAIVQGPTYHLGGPTTLPTLIIEGGPSSAASVAQAVTQVAQTITPGAQLWASATGYFHSGYYLGGGVLYAAAFAEAGLAVFTLGASNVAMTQVRVGINAARPAISNIGSRISSIFRTCSFHGDTRVKTDLGLLPISELRAGKHWVLARDELTGELGYRPVVDTYSNHYDETVTLVIRDLETGEKHTIVTNRVHPFYVAAAASELRLVANGTRATGRWVEAQHLERGSRLLDADGTFSEVVSSTIEPRPLQAYNLTVGGYHTYFVVGADNDNAQPVWVHNSCDWIRIRGLVQNRPLQQLTHAELITAFEGTGYTLSGHAVMRLGDPRISPFGFHTPNDIARILNKGELVEAGNGAMARVLNGVGVVFDPQTKNILTITPW
jgi:RHS repeat-associated protein